MFIKVAWQVIHAGFALPNFGLVERIATLSNDSVVCPVIASSAVSASLAGNGTPRRCSWIDTRLRLASRLITRRWHHWVKDRIQRYNTVTLPVRFPCEAYAFKGSARLIPSPNLGVAQLCAVPFSEEMIMSSMASEAPEWPDQLST